MFLVESVGYP